MREFSQILHSSSFSFFFSQRLILFLLSPLLLLLFVCVGRWVACGWVACGRQRVTAVVLPRNNMVGPLVEEVKWMNDLKALCFPHNQLSGHIPEVGRLRKAKVGRLRTLYSKAKRVGGCARRAGGRGATPCIFSFSSFGSCPFFSLLIRLVCCVVSPGLVFLEVAHKPRPLEQQNFGCGVRADF